jgi:hypothetical protein
MCVRGNPDDQGIRWREVGRGGNAGLLETNALVLEQRIFKFSKMRAGSKSLPDLENVKLARAVKQWVDPRMDGKAPISSLFFGSAPFF